MLELRSVSPYVGRSRVVSCQASMFRLGNSHDVFTRPNFVVDVSGHVPPHLQAIFKHLMLAVLFNELWLCRVWCASLDTLGVVGRTLPARSLLPPGPANRGVDKTLNVPSGLRWRFLLGPFDGELAEMGDLSRLAMIAGPFSRALALQLVRVVDAGPVGGGANLLLAALALCTGCCRTAVLLRLHLQYRSP